VSIAADTSLGAVTLTVGDLDAQAAFYRDAIGLRELRRAGNVVEFGETGDAEPLVVLVGDPAAPPRPARTTGLFHLALLVPSRAELARSIHRVTAAGRRFTGAADHLVSEALYLDDPEGNGIEIYRDRRRDEWSHAGGELQIATLPLDLQGVLDGVPAGETGHGMAPGTRIGHVHLQVASIPAADAFWVDGVGFDPVVRGFPGALFVSAGGYHHHLGLNTWAGLGAPAPPPGARGLRSFAIVLPDGVALQETLERVRAAGLEVRDEAGRATVSDPSGNRAVLTAP
jgi:catechol 2,3-dioxygenase